MAQIWPMQGPVAGRARSAASPLPTSTQHIVRLGTKASWLHLVPSIVAIAQAEWWSR